MGGAAHLRKGWHLTMIGRHIHQQKNTLNSLSHAKNPWPLRSTYLDLDGQTSWKNVEEATLPCLSFRIMAGVRLDKSLYKHSRNLVTNLWLQYHVLGEPTYLMLRQGKSHLQNAKLPAEKGYNHVLQTFGIHGNPFRLCPRYVFAQRKLRVELKTSRLFGRIRVGSRFFGGFSG